MSIKTLALKTAAKTALFFKKNGATIAFAGGIISVVTGTVVACTETLKMDKIVDETKEKLEKCRSIEPGMKQDADGNEFEYTEDDKKKDLFAIYAKAGVKTVKNYLPAIILIIAGLTGLCWSHRAMVKKVVALGAEVTSLTAFINEYRGRVKEELGDDADFHFATGAVKEVIEETLDDGTKVKKEEWTGDATTTSPYTFIFSEDTSSAYDSHDSEYNSSFLRGVESAMNAELSRKGHVFLNDTLIALGIDLTEEGQFAGWRYKGNGDGYISFNMRKVYPVHEEPITGHHIPDKPYFILEFNCDGDITDKVFKKKKNFKINEDNVVTYC